MQQQSNLWSGDHVFEFPSIRSRGQNDQLITALHLNSSHTIRTTHSTVTSSFTYVKFMRDKWGAPPGSVVDKKHRELDCSSLTSTGGNGGKMKDSGDGDTCVGGVALTWPASYETKRRL